MLNKSKILQVIEVLTPDLKTQTNIPDEISQLPLTNAFANDTSISLALNCNEAGKSPEIDEIVKIYNEFQQVASLVLNDTKSTLSVQ